MDHHDPRERALYVLSTRRLPAGEHLRALLDDDQDVRRAALAHPGVTPHLLALACAARCLRNGAHPGRAVVDYLAHPLATHEHAMHAVRSAAAHGAGAEEAGVIAKAEAVRLRFEEPLEKADQDQHPEAHRLAQLPAHEFKAAVAGGFSLPMYRGHSNVADPGPKWYASHPATAASYARPHGANGVVTHGVVTMKRPYVASGAEIINATQGTIDRLRAAGHDGIVAQWNKVFPTKGNPNPIKEIWAVAFGQEGK